MEIDNSTTTALNNTDDELYEASTGVVIILSSCYGAISVLAVVGNSLVLWAVAGSRRMQRSATNWLLANLALADIIIGLFVVPFQFQAALSQRWDLPDFMCAFCPFIQTLSVNVSVFTLTALAIRRYRAVSKPLSEASITRCQVRLTIVLIWTIGAFLAAPMAKSLQVIEVDDSHGGYKPFCAFVGLGETLLAWYRRLLVALQYFAPLCVISAMYIRLAYLLWGTQAPGNAENSRDARILKKKKRVIKMLVVVVALFAFCWLPLQSYNVLQDIFPTINNYRYINIIWFTCDWLAMSNSVCNPFVYGIYNEKFRRSFQSRCMLCQRVMKLPQSPPTFIPVVHGSSEISSARQKTKLALKSLNNSPILLNKTRQSNNSAPPTPESVHSVMFGTPRTRSSEL